MKKYVLALLYWFIFSSMFSISCSTKRSKSPALKNLSILNTSFYNSVMIYFSPGSLTVQTAKDSLAKKLPQFQLTEYPADTTSSDGYSLTSLEAGDAAFYVPDTSMGYVSEYLSTEELASLQESKRAILLTFFGKPDHVIEKQYEISKAVASVAAGKEVLIADLNTYQFYSPKEWFANRVANFSENLKDITNQITVHIYREDDQFCRAVTLGMDKFCLPELSVKGFACSDQNSIGNLINATVQSIGEDPKINSDYSVDIDLTKIKNQTLAARLILDTHANARRRVRIKLKPVDPEEGDNDSPQLVFVFENPSYSSPVQEQIATIDSLFGSADSIKYTVHDPELLAASKAARTHIPALKQMFSKGLPPGSSLMIKLPFKTDDGKGSEWMWVEVTSWSGSRNSGILQNEPFHITKLKVGAEVEFDDDDIFDYILHNADGTSEGNLTGEILEKRNY